MWFIYGSKIAACIGKNRYQKKWEAFLSIFRRIDNDIHYREARNRLQSMGINFLEMEDKIREITTSTGVEGTVKELMNISCSNSVELQKQISDFEIKIGEKETALKQNTEKIKEKLEQLYCTQMHYKEKLKKAEEQLQQFRELETRIETTRRPRRKSITFWKKM